MRNIYQSPVPFIVQSTWRSRYRDCYTPITDSTQGVRTVGNWSITVPVSTSPSGLNNEWYWALIYVPQGSTANNLFATTGDTNGSLYEPNQYVIACGISDANAGPIRIRSRIMRKLHSGDFVSLIVGTKNSQDPASAVLNALVSYSVKYN